MRRRLIPRFLAVGALVLALAGCVRFQAELRLAPDDTVDGEIVVAVLASDDTDEGRAQAQASADEIEVGLLGTLRDASGVSVEAYEDDDYVGSVLRLDGVALAAFDGSGEGALRFAREGDDFVFTGALDFTEQASGSDEEKGDDSNLTVAVTFPGTVEEHNGELSGTTVSWSTALDERLEMSARGSATGSGIPIVPILVVAAVVLAVVAAVVVVVLVLVLRRARRTATPLPETVDPGGPTEPAADPVAPAPDDEQPAGGTPPKG